MNYIDNINFKTYTSRYCLKLDADTDFDYDNDEDLLDELSLNTSLINFNKGI